MFDKEFSKLFFRRSLLTQLLLYTIFIFPFHFLFSQFLHFIFHINSSSTFFTKQILLFLIVYVNLKRYREMIRSRFRSTPSLYFLYQSRSHLIRHQIIQCKSFVFFNTCGFLFVEYPESKGLHEVL